MASKLKSVSEAIMSRVSIRDFIPHKAPSIELILSILQSAVAEMGDLKFKVYILEGQTMRLFVSEIEKKLESGYFPNEQEYNVYPPELKQKYHKRRKKVAVDMYKLLDIPYGDKLKRLQHLKRNWSFFGAPIGLFFTVSSTPNDFKQFVHLGMLLQKIMLSLQQNGIDSCSQEAWAHFAKTIHSLLGTRQNELLFCGMAVGFRNENAKVNQLRSDRMTIDELVKRQSSKL